MKAKSRVENRPPRSDYPFEPYSNKLPVGGATTTVHLEEMGSIISRSGIPLPAFALRSYA